jgi:hypothetical protein
MRHAAKMAGQGRVRDASAIDAFSDAYEVS